MNRRPCSAAVFLSLLTLVACTVRIAPTGTTISAGPGTATLIPPTRFSFDLSGWEAIQAALAVELLPNEPVDDVLCEWEILGMGEQDVYVWAVCFGIPAADRPESYAPRASIPAVLFFAGDGAVVRVTIPAYGQSYAEGVQDLFPEDIQELIFNRAADIEGMAEHAVSRRNTPEPPRIILAATPQP